MDSRRNGGGTAGEDTSDRAVRRREGGRGSRLCRWILLAAAVAVALLVSGALVGAVVYVTYNRSLPADLSAVADYHPRSLTRVYSRDGELIGEFYLERRIVVPLSRVAPVVVNAFLAAEDVRFFEHRGVDPRGILRALIANIRAGHIVQGGSTITQQVVKNLLLSPERSFSRKVKEAILSYRLERELTKEQILEVYLNMVYLGHGAYGVEAAARSYFGKSAAALSLAEAAMLAGLVKAPGRDSPLLDYQRARERQRYVLDQMVENGLVTTEEADAAFRQPLMLLSQPDVTDQAAPYFVQEVRQMVQARFGGLGRAQRGGWRIETTLDMDLQRAARAAVRNGLEALAGRAGFQGPLRRVSKGAITRFREQTWRDIAYLGLKRRDRGDENLLEPGVTYPAVVLSNHEGVVRVAIGRVEALLPAEDLAIVVPRYAAGAWTFLEAGQVLEPGSIIHVRYLGTVHEGGPAMATLSGVPAAEAALVAIEPRTGAVRAMIGGYDYRLSRYNRAVQSRRQTGSAFKPIIYAAALAAGMTQVTVVDDVRTSYRIGGSWWTPRNYANRYYGKVTLRTALTKSLNSVAVKLLDEVGLDRVIRLARKLGIRSPLVPRLTLALGVSDLTLLELTNAYATFANGGRAVAPVMITRILDGEGNILFDIDSRTQKVGAPARTPGPTPSLLLRLGGARRLEQPISPAVAYVLTDMLQNVIAAGTGRAARDIGRPAAGKTGTTNGYRDAWFLGYTPDLVAGTWVGTDTNLPLGPSETGGRTAAPIWLEFMREATKGLPPKGFDVPPGVVFARVDPRTGKASTGRRSRYLPFVMGTLPEDILPQDSTPGGPDDW